jgi:hypothetical protein
MKSIRTAYPVTAMQLALRGTLRKVWERHFPPAYSSKRGKVKRWTPDAAEKRSLYSWGIRGRSACLLRIEPISARSNLCRYRAYGTYHQMELLRTTALSIWQELPGGQEIETLFDRMFPKEIQLEVTPTIDRTTLE